jgi:hypothetical protein
MRDLIMFLKLPINKRGHRRTALRAEWIDSADAPLDAGGVLVD